MKLAIIILLSIFFSISYAQIGAKVKSSTASCVGEWTNKDFGYEMKLVLNAGGKGSFDGDALIFTQSGNTLILNSSGQSTKYTYQIADNNTMILTGGDLQGQVKFIRSGTKSTVQLPQASQAPQAPKTSNIRTSIIGAWVGAGEELEYKADGIMIYNGNLLNYFSTGNTITVKTQKGDVNFQYTINEGQLMLTSNGQTFIYTRKGSSQNQGSSQVPQTGNAGGQGVIAPELVGKWCYINVSSSSYGGSSTEECFILNQNGTYEYHNESSMSATGYNSYGNQTYNGGTAGQSSDKGTWRVQGNNLIVSSQTQGQSVYQFAKQNHPKNGDPMLVINGRTYVTYYQKAPWR